MRDKIELAVLSTVFVFLSCSLAEEQERTEHLKFDIREYEEENEDLCKRIQETSLKLRDKEAACERVGTFSGLL